MRRLRASDKAVSQKTYLELDDVVPSWIEVVVANFFVIPQILFADALGRVIELD
jgi:hypothetical protein